MEGREEEQQKPSVGDRWEDIQGQHSWEGLLDPFKSTLKFEILRYGDFARVCYDAVINEGSRKGNLLLQEFDNLRNCGYEITESIFVSVPSMMSYITPGPGMRTVWSGFIAVCTNENEYRKLGRHKEESLSKYSVRDIIQSEISRLLEIFAFASPRVGNQAFTSHMENIGVNVLRVVLKGDLITMFPSGIVDWNREEHCDVGTVISLDPNSSGELKLWKIDAMGRHDLDRSATNTISRNVPTACR
ncbi:phospholipase A(1) DAD1, chloroplastic-like [Cryptomeria japonica]|uniref:phospholipase A(1) DAD1, chloroplastic-like n=1 Tax=Cryptomeria japonica TaxID=3369 RepID=UPI0027DA49BC|nr:phospholipase A(1) DAD1, chloroplastic-like [Cryptomeria japonica]